MFTHVNIYIDSVSFTPLLFLTFDLFLCFYLHQEGYVFTRVSLFVSRIKKKKKKVKGWGDMEESWRKGAGLVRDGQVTFHSQSGYFFIEHELFSIKSEVGMLFDIDGLLLCVPF